MNRDEILENADFEGQLNVAVDQLEEGGELTLQELRTLPGTSGMSDSELIALRDESGRVDEAPAASVQEAAANKVAEALGGEAVETSKGWKVYDEKGAEIADLDKLTAKQFLQLKIGYTANGKEQKKSFDEMVRVTKFGHLNERKLSEERQQKESFAKQLQEAMPELKQLRGISGTVKYAMTQFHLGNDAPLDRLLKAFKAQMGGDPNQPQVVEQPQREDNSAQVAEGQRVYFEEIQPEADKLAEQYAAGFPVEQQTQLKKELRQVVKAFIAQDPGGQGIVQRVKEYINEELPLHLENAGWKRGMKAAVAPMSELESLRAQVAELKKSGSKGSVAEIVRKKNQSIAGDDSSGVRQVEGDENEVPKAALKSAVAFRKFMRDEK